MAGSRTCIVPIERGFGERPWVFCSRRVRERTARGRDADPERYLCQWHYDLAYQAGVRFARVGYIHYSKFVAVPSEGFSARVLQEAFARGVRDETLAHGARAAGAA